MEDYQNRVIEEHQDLNSKYHKLTGFVLSKDFLALPSEERTLLMMQQRAMAEYRNCLRERIKAFEKQ